MTVMRHPRRHAPNRIGSFYSRLILIKQSCLDHILQIAMEHGMSLPTAETLEAAHSFPCAYVFKVIGTAEGNFTSRVVSSVRDELGMKVDPPYTFRTTKNGKHIAITLEPECESAQQVIAIYSRLTGMDGIVMLL